CSRRFCIIQALIQARAGNLDKGLVFAGENVYRIGEILSVKDIFTMLFSGLDYRD
ncbi:MAG TPA: 2-nitropropane dioxygenase, partial [Candidatus Riflebacteria bacterium]|nr:2-nitropropane dioxygenase [Candidatus Riflebacteria bacterium]